MSVKYAVRKPHLITLSRRVKALRQQDNCPLDSTITATTAHVTLIRVNSINGINCSSIEKKAIDTETMPGVQRPH